MTNYLIHGEMLKNEARYWIENNHCRTWVNNCPYSKGCPSWRELQELHFADIAELKAENLHQETLKEHLLLRSSSIYLGVKSVTEKELKLYISGNGCNSIEAAEFNNRFVTPSRGILADLLSEILEVTVIINEHNRVVISSITINDKDSLYSLSRNTKLFIHQIIDLYEDGYVSNLIEAAEKLQTIYKTGDVGDL